MNFIAEYLVTSPNYALFDTILLSLRITKEVKDERQNVILIHKMFHTNIVEFASVCSGFCSVDMVINFTKKILNCILCFFERIKVEILHD